MAIEHTGGKALEDARYSIDYSKGLYEPVYLGFYGKNNEDRFIRIILSYGFVDEDGNFHADPEIHIGYIEKYNQFFPFYIRAGSGNNVVDKRSAEFDSTGKIVWENTNEIQRDVHSFTNSILTQIRERHIEANGGEEE